MQASNLAGFAAIEEQKALVQRMMAKAHAVSSRTGEELAAKWAKNISYYLYKRCAEFSPTAEMFSVVGSSSIAIGHKFKIAYLKKGMKIAPSPFSDKGKKRKDFTRVAEIMKDRGNHRKFIASGWLQVKKIVTKSGERLQAQAIRNGAVRVDVQGGLPPKTTITIVNTSDFARSFHEKHNIVALALSDEARDLAEYVSRKTHEDINEILRTK
jgi:hypothetical protein